MHVGTPHQLFIPRLTLQSSSFERGRRTKKSPPRGNLKGKFIELKKVNKLD